MRRPVGVTLGAILYFLVAGLFLLFLFGVADPQAWWVVGAAGIPIGGIAFLVLSSTFATIGWGLWTLKKWARVAAIALVLLDFVATHVGANIIGLGVPSLIRAFIGLVFFLYLDAPDVKAAFQLG